MKIALIHDHLIQSGGAERVLKVMSELYPEAPIYTLVYDSSRLHPLFDKSRVRTSFLQHIPFSTKNYQWLLPLMPLATESYDLSEFDVILSSSSAFSKGIITRPGTTHICYCHTPTRYLWMDTHSYVNEIRQPRIVKAVLPLMLSRMRIWDRLAAERVDSFIANSLTVQRRIQKYYNRGSEIIHPPVSVAQSYVGKGEGSYYLAGGRLVSYKRLDIVVDAFNRLGIALKLFGTGPAYSQLASSAKKNIEFVGNVSDADLQKLYGNCIAYIHPQEEDFGITAIEAMAAGRPVIAYAGGGALETIQGGITGQFLYDQDYAALIDLVLHFKPEMYHPHTIHEYAMQFDTSVFKEKILQYVRIAFERIRK